MRKILTLILGGLITVFTVTIFLIWYLWPLVFFKSLHEWDLQGVTSHWMQQENQRTEHAFGDALSPQADDAIKAFLDSKKDHLYPYSMTDSVSVAIRAAERYQDCHDYVLTENQVILPLRQAQQFDGERCLYQVAYVKQNAQRNLISVNLYDPRFRESDRLLLIRHDGQQLQVVQQRDIWLKQFFFVADGHLWYARYEDPGSFAPDPCLLWQLQDGTDQCVLWAHALNNLPAYESLRFYPGSDAHRIWLVLSGNKTNYLILCVQDETSGRWQFRDTGVHGVGRAEVLGADLIYEKVQNPNDVLHSRYHGTALWRIRENGAAQEILPIADQMRRWSSRHGELQVMLQSMPGYPAQVLRWRGDDWESLNLHATQQQSSFLSIGHKADVLSYYDAMAQRFLSYRVADGWRDQPLDMHPSGTRLQTVSANSADGSSVACLVLDRGISTKPVATVFKIYGAYGSPNLPFPNEEQNALLASGVRLVFPQTRGGSSGGERWAHAAQGEGRIKVVEDAEACLHKILKQGQAETGRIISWGSSAGALPAYWLLQRNSQMVAAAVLDRPYLAMQVHRSEINSVEYGSQEQASSRAFLQAFSPYDSMLAGQLRKGKILFLCGGEDMNTPDWHCRASHTALRSHGYQDSWLHIAEHSAHGAMPALHPEAQTELRLLVNFIRNAGEPVTKR